MAKEVDTLVAVVPGGAGTRNLINAAVLAALGPRGILINVARGSVVDEVALIEALRSGTILAAGLDVYADEPRVPQALIDLDNVVLVPHIGSATHHTRGRMGRLVVENLRSWFDGRGPVTPVPETPWPAAANRGSVDGPPRGAPVVDTDRLVLRKFTPHDAGFILRLLNEPSFLQSIGDRGVRTIEQAIHYLADGPIQSYARHGHGLYLVVLKETLQPIGMCGLLKRDRFPDADLGYAFLPEFWSRGYACESAAAVLRFARSSLALSRIVAFVSPGNAASVRVLEKLGFSFAGGTKLEPDASEVALYELCSIEEC